MSIENRELFRPSAAVATSAGVTASGQSSAFPKMPFVLVHGAWHGAWTYERIIPLLAELGHAAVARDLPAHGLNARIPLSYLRRPLDSTAFATEKSPVAGTTLDDYVDSIIQTIEEVRSLGHDKVVLVGHSMGGLPITAVAERVPQYISHLVYLTAFMPKSGVPGVAYIAVPENEGELVGPQLKADPAIVGALRMDHRSEDVTYRANGKQAYYGDVSDDEYLAVANLMTPDVPVAPLATPVVTTRERWGSVRRHYIMCLQDQAIRPALQQRFIDEANAFLPASPTIVHQMDASHSPFISQPTVLAELLAGIAATYSQVRNMGDR
jgi:pimeloyl-ACP methyl ester carboxylesterase